MFLKINNILEGSVNNYFKTFKMKIVDNNENEGDNCFYYNKCVG